MECKYLVEQKDGLLTAKTMLAPKILSLNSFSGVSQDAGAVFQLENWRKEPWNWQNFFAESGHAVYSGQAVGGQTLSALLQQKLDSPQLFNLIKGLRKFFLDEFACLKGLLFNTESLVLFDGCLLVLPQRFFSFVSSYLPSDIFLRFCAPYNHPSAGHHERALFCLSSLCYHLLSGNAPYRGASQEEMHRQMRRNLFLPLDSALFNVESRLAHAIDAGLCLAGSAADWDFLDSLEGGEIKTPAGPPEMGRFWLKRQKLERRRALRNSFNAWFSLYKRKAGAALACGLAFILLAAPALKKSLTPPKQHGYEAHEAVEAYYEALKTFDFLMLKDLLKKKTFSDDIDELNYMFAAIRQRHALFGRRSLLDPESWLAEGSLPLEPGQFIYGISDVEIEFLAENVFVARYKKWLPAAWQQPKGEKLDRGAAVFLIEDRVELSCLNKNELFVIESLERNQRFWRYAAI